MSAIAVKKPVVLSTVGRPFFASILVQIWWGLLNRLFFTSESLEDVLLSRNWIISDGGDVGDWAD
jgi:hypothetical protein